MDITQYNCTHIRVFVKLFLNQSSNRQQLNRSARPAHLNKTNTLTALRPDVSRNLCTDLLHVPLYRHQHMAALNIARRIAYTVTCDVNARGPHVRKMVSLTSLSGLAAEKNPTLKLQDALSSITRIVTKCR